MCLFPIAKLPSVMHQSFVTPATPPSPWAGDNGANVRGNDLLGSPAGPGKCRACDIAQIYPFTLIKSRAMTLSRSPQCRAFSRAVMDEKSLSPLCRAA